MEAIRKYFTGPVLLSLVSGVAVCILAFIDTNESKALTIPILILIAGLGTISAGIWGGIRKIGDQTNLLRAIGPKTRHIISFAKEQFSSMAISAKEFPLQKENQPTEEQVRLVFSKLDPKAQSPVCSVQNGQFLNWLEYMYQYNAQTQSLIEYIYQFMPFLEPKLVRILGELEDCYHFKEIELLANGPGVGNNNLEFAAGAFSQYQRIINELNIYFDDNLKKYTKNTPAMAVQPIINASNKAPQPTPKNGAAKL